MSQEEKRIYMDYQASTPVDYRVVEAMRAYHFDHPGNPHATEHAFGWEANAAVDKAAATIADILNVDRDEIIFTSGATEANNQAILGLAENAPPHRKKILISSIEHACVFAAARAAVRRYGCALETIPVNSHGLIDMKRFEALIDENTLLVSVVSVNNEIGAVQPTDKIGELCQKNGAIFHSDSVHRLATGRFDATGADMVSLSAHKIYGPKGIGALYIRRDLQSNIAPLIYGGGQQNGLRAGTLPVQLCVGFAQAAELMISKEASAEREKIKALRDKFVKAVLLLNDAFLENGPEPGDRHPGNTNICFTGFDAHQLLTMMQPYIAASTGSACHSGTNEPSHVLRSIGLSSKAADSSIRFGFGRFTVDKDIDAAVFLISRALQSIKESLLNEKNTSKDCPICNGLRPLSNHLFELSEYCFYLGNTVEYKNGKAKREIRTESIGEWLKLASQLEEVRISTWKFAGSDGTWCGTAADKYDSDTNHYTTYSTDLTRFIFVSYAAEELYRFVAGHYDDFCQLQKILEKNKVREPSMKAAFLIDLCDPTYLPQHFSHIIERLDYSYSRYRKDFSPQMTGMDKIEKSALSFGFHLVRNLRNHIAHGVFPLVENPEYGGYEGKVFLTELLKQASRVSAIYIQMLLVKYNSGFKSYEYNNIAGANWEPCDYFIQNCSVDYGKMLHISGGFSFEKWIDHEY